MPKGETEHHKNPKLVHFLAVNHPYCSGFVTILEQVVGHLRD